MDPCSGSHRSSSFVLPLPSDTGVSTSLLSDTESRWADVVLWWRWWRGIRRCSKGRTHWYSRKHQWYIGGYIAINSLAISDEMWFLTAFLVIRVPMIFAEFPQGKNCGSFFKMHNCDEEVEFFDVYSGFFVCSHLAVGRHHRRRISRYPHGLQLSRVKVLLTDHMHTRSGINHKLSFLQPSCWGTWENPLLCKREECSLVVRFELVNSKHVWQDPKPRFGHIALVFQCLRGTEPRIL